MRGDPVGAARREAARRERLGADAVCVLCGQVDLECLTLIEGHHVPGRAYEPGVKVPVCLNCHRKCTRKIEDAGIPMQPPLDPLEKLAMITGSVGLFHVDGGRALLRWSDELLNLSDFLSIDSPGWAERYQQQPEEPPDG